MLPNAALKSSSMSTACNSGMNNEFRYEYLMDGPKKQTKNLTFVKFAAGSANILICPTEQDQYISITNQSKYFDEVCKLAEISSLNPSILIPFFQ